MSSYSPSTGSGFASSSWLADGRESEYDIVLLLKVALVRHGIEKRNDGRLRRGGKCRGRFASGSVAAFGCSCCLKGVLKCS